MTVGQVDGGGGLRVVGICGSLRAGSWNRQLLDVAAALAPSRLTIEPVDIGGLPLYDADLDGDAPPEAVVVLKDRLASAHGALFVSPEYNYSIPGVLKNAIDWASRPAYRSPLRDLPVTSLSAGVGAFGGARVHGVLQTTLLGCGAAVLPWPGLSLTLAHEKLRDGQLADDPSAAWLTAQLAAFADWIDALAGFGANAARPR